MDSSATTVFLNPRNADWDLGLQLMSAPLAQWHVLCDGAAHILLSSRPSSGIIPDIAVVCVEAGVSTKPCRPLYAVLTNELHFFGPRGFASWRP